MQPPANNWTHHPWFKPVWRRWAVVVGCLGWTAFETAWGEPVFATMAFLAFGYSLWTLIMRYREPEAARPEDKSDA